MERPAKIRNNGRYPIGIRPPGGITRRRIPLFRVGHAGRLRREGHLAHIVNRKRGYSRKFRCTNQYTGRRNVPLYPVERRPLFLIGRAPREGRAGYFQRMNDSGFWQIENMKAPINSQADDFGITFGEEESGFFSSNRGDGRGYDNIYSFELPSISVWISGTVIDKDDEPVPDAIIRIVGNDGSNQKEFARKDGSFRFKLDRGVHYVMLASCRGYLNSKQEFISDNEEADAEYGVNFVLASISKPILIENIFYDFDRATLRPESETSLNELVKMLNDNPNVSIELGAHTDLKGSEQYNLRLSDRRARSVVDYLIKSGINPDRLQPKGYGESRPKVITKKLATQYPQFKEGDVLDEKYINGLSPEDQEIANQINRRTEFQVLSITWNLY